jgi:hypothetical protein
MTTTVSGTTPQAVSAVLRRAGWLPVPSGREGVHVKRSHGGQVLVVVGFHSRRRAHEQAALITEALQARGYDVTPSLLTSYLLYVTRRAS